MASAPHDALFKATFEQVDIARSELELVLPASVREHLDLATLAVEPGSFRDEELQQTHTDLLYSVRADDGKEALVYLLFEHQSSFDATMPLRLLRYVVRIWERWVVEHEGTKALPVVVPVLLHHGDGGWTVPPELASMLDCSPELLEATRPYLPHFRFVLDDLSALPLEVIATRALHALGRIVQVALWSSRSIERLERAAPVMASLIGALMRDARTRALLMQLYAYLWRAAPPDVAADDIRDILLRVAGPEGGEDVVNAAQELIERGRFEGSALGRVAGLRDAIVQVLAARGVPLSAAGRDRIAAAADGATLEAWLKRAATAASEGEVFAGVEND